MCWPTDTGLLIIERKEAHSVISIFNPDFSLRSFSNHSKGNERNRHGRLTGWKNREQRSRLPRRLGFGRKSTGNGGAVEPQIFKATPLGPWLTPAVHTNRVRLGESIKD